MDKAIAHSLADFSFSRNNLTFDDTSLYRDDPRAPDEGGDGSESDSGPLGTDDVPHAMDGNGGLETEDFFQGDQAVDDGYGGYDGTGGDDYGRAESGSVDAEGEQGHQIRSGPFVPFDPCQMPTERDLIVAMADVDGQSDVLGYFDQNLMKNWAGPEHWKLRRVIRKREDMAIMINVC